MHRRRQDWKDKTPEENARLTAIRRRMERHARFFHKRKDSSFKFLAGTFTTESADKHIPIRDLKKGI